MRFGAAQRLANTIVDRGIGGMVLAIHLKIHPQGRPTGAEIRLPLQFDLTAGHRQGPFSSGVIVKRNGAVAGIHVLHRHIQHPAGFRMDWQKTGIGLLAFLAQAGQHDRHDRVITFAGQQQGRIELAGFVKLGR